MWQKAPELIQVQEKKKKPTCPYKCYHGEIYKKQRAVQPNLNKDAIYLCCTDHFGDFNISDFIMLDTGKHEITMCQKL